MIIKHTTNKRLDNTYFLTYQLNIFTSMCSFQISVNCNPYKMKMNIKKCFTHKYNSYC